MYLNLCWRECERGTKTKYIHKTLILYMHVVISQTGPKAHYVLFLWPYSMKSIPMKNIIR